MIGRCVVRCDGCLWESVSDSHRLPPPAVCGNGCVIDMCVDRSNRCDEGQIGVMKVK